MSHKATLIDQPITNRWSGEVMFTAQIDADETTPLGVRIGLAVKWAVAERKPLARANLARANLAGARCAALGVSIPEPEVA
ncbi:hypothetical protein ACO2Q0_02845 [Phenylobacterium sp. VNQ135]|uniref:hypothetical protein n=1 Tax=Phenylobacterium sp. VNQ135 TaxID=3400922 RepID=UPI003C00B9AF